MDEASCWRVDEEEWRMNHWAQRRSPVEGRKRSTKWGPRAKSRGKTGQQREIDRKRWTDRMKDERENREDEAKKAVLFQ